MPFDLSTKSACVVDNGLFSELASTLARSFGKVYYTSPWVSGFPSSSQIELGEGFPDFERANDIWDIIDDVDLFVFPDIYQGPLQEYLVRLGKRVWGSRNGDELEIYRDDAKAHFAELDIPQGPYEVVRGMAELHKYIKSRGEQKLWVKINLPRGDTETFCIEDYDLGKNQLDNLSARLGPAADTQTFIVEDHLADTLDLAIDTYCVDGQFPSTSLLGTEKKGEAYLCAVKEWRDTPANLRAIYEALSPDLEKYQYRNSLSLESRVRGNNIWLGDPCCRSGSPPFELQLNMVTNLAEIMWQGADGGLVEPKYAGRYGYEVIVHSDWADEHPLLVKFPDKYRDRIKFRYATQYRNDLWIMPQSAGPRIAAVVASGDDMDACIEDAHEISRELKGNKIETFTDVVDGLKKNLEKFKSWGILF